MSVFLYHGALKINVIIITITVIVIIINTLVCVICQWDGRGVSVGRRHLPRHEAGCYQYHDSHTGTQRVTQGLLTVALRLGLWWDTEINFNCYISCHGSRCQYTVDKIACFTTSRILHRLKFRLCLCWHISTALQWMIEWVTDVTSHVLSVLVTREQKCLEVILNLAECSKWQHTWTNISSVSC